MRDRLKPAGETRAADVLHRMRTDIISCALKPGAKLRFEALRDMYAVSFSTLREALSRLVAEGLVIAEDQRGFVVAPVSIDDLNDLTYVRVLVERECIGLAIKHGNDDWEADIIGSFHRMDRLQTRLGANYYLSGECWRFARSCSNARTATGACRRSSGQSGAPRMSNTR